ncbi:MAG: diguanylate cyclase, partial [Pseudomonadota bacterium]
MISFIKSPLFRISFSMVMLVISLLLAADFLGLFPKLDNNALTERKFIAETLAVHVAMELEQDDEEKISELLRTTVTRNALVESVAVRRGDGTFVDSYGSHQQNWNLEPTDRSTPTHVQVPLYEGDNQIATVEIRYKAISAGQSLIDRRASFASVVIFVAISGFSAFCVFLKRTLRELDPDAVIPERVRKALDTLAEGLLIINRDGEIVFSNAAFARTTGKDASELAGKNCESLEWELTNTTELPWLPLMRGGEIESGASIRLNTGYQQVSTFTVNATPIVARADEIRGALVTFADVTEVEIKNAELRNALVKLEKSKQEITRQNEELEYLATRDPLTGSLNRRSFFSGFESVFEQAKLNHTELTCIMSDIDHFKSVNDNHGHGVGDEVIKHLANVLANYARPNDLVGRFGGEEFCVVMPATTIKTAMQIAEQIRDTIEKGENTSFADKCKITASFGVASINSGSRKPNDLVDQADKALYHSKQNGRNQVTEYSQSIDNSVTGGSGTPAATPTPAISPSPAPAPIVQPTPVIQQSVPILATGKQKQKQAQEQEKVDELVAKALSDNKSSVPVLAVREKKEAASSILESSSLDTTPEYGTLRLDRTLLIDRIEQALNIATKNAHHVGVLLISIDALQRINDTLGFSVNEKLYRKINARLHATLRDANLTQLLGTDDHSFSITRYGDTEICLTLHHIKQVMDFNEIQDRILESFDRTISVDGHEVYVALDTGISVYPNHGTDADHLIRSASIAMRKARDTDGQNSFVYFSPEMNEESRKLIRLETELHQALTRSELFVAYQPKVDLRSGEIV